MGDYIWTTVSILGAVAITGLSINHLLKDSNYQVLKREGLVPIVEKGDSAWRILIDKYGGESHPKVGNNPREDELFEWCDELLLSNSSPEGLRQTRKWCTKPKSNGATIKETKSELREIDSSEGDEWESKVQEYSSWWRFSDDISMMKRGDVSVLKSDLDVVKLKTWCEIKKNSYFLGENNKDFESLIRWCYVKQKKR